MDWFEIGKTFGFEALCIIGLAWYTIFKDKQHREDIKQIREENKQLREEHQKEVKELTKAFNRISDIVQNLVDEIRRSK